MKIQPVPQGAMPVTTPEGSSTSNSSKARAKAAFAGVTITPSESNAPTEYEHERQKAFAEPKKIKFNTKASIYRNLPDDLLSRLSAESQEPVAAPEAATADNAQIPATSEQATAAIEEIKPLSPQFAALAKQKRALQAKEREIAEREAALTGTTGTPDTGFMDRIKSDPLGVLKEAGVTYDQLTEAVLAGDSPNPAVSRLESEVRALKTALENQNKSLAEKDQFNEKQVLTQMRKDADRLVELNGDEYELVRATGSQSQVVDLIKRTFDETGEVLDVQEALVLVENELFEESLKLAQLKKIQSKLTPGQPQQQAPASPAQKQMRTLTARDGASVPLSAKERALLAFRNQLPR